MCVLGCGQAIEKILKDRLRLSRVELFDEDTRGVGKNYCRLQLVVARRCTEA